MPESSSFREAELFRQLQERDGQLAQAKREIELLREKIDLLVRKLFGAKSEPSGARSPKGGAFARRAAPAGAGKSWTPRNSYYCCKAWMSREPSGARQTAEGSPKGGAEATSKAPEPVVAEAARRSTAPSPPRERGPRLPEPLPVIGSPAHRPPSSPPPPRRRSSSPSR